MATHIPKRDPLLDQKATRHVRLYDLAMREIDATHTSHRDALAAVLARDATFGSVLPTAFSREIVPFGFVAKHDPRAFADLLRSSTSMCALARECAAYKRNTNNPAPSAQAEEKKLPMPQEMYGDYLLAQAPAIVDALNAKLKRHLAQAQATVTTTHDTRRRHAPARAARVCPHHASTGRPNPREKRRRHVCQGVVHQGRTRRPDTVHHQRADADAGRQDRRTPGASAA